MNRYDESFDRHGFDEAMAALTSVSKIIEIQDAARESFNAEISVGYSKLQGYQYTIYFLIHRQDAVSVQSRTDLAVKLSGLLSYDEVAVYSETSLEKATFNSNYSSFARISPENVEGIRKFIANYTHYIGENRSKFAFSSQSQFY